MFEWLWRGPGEALPGVLPVPTFHLAPLLITRETNLKFRQAPMAMHHELTSVRKMASFQGERGDSSTPSRPLSAPLYSGHERSPSHWVLGMAMGSAGRCWGLRWL